MNIVAGTEIVEEVTTAIYRMAFFAEFSVFHVTGKLYANIQKVILCECLFMQCALMLLVVDLCII